MYMLMYYVNCAVYKYKHIYIHVILYVYMHVPDMYIYGAVRLIVRIVQKFQNRFCYTVYLYMARLLTRRLPGFSAGRRNGLPFS